MDLKRSWVSDLACIVERCVGKFCRLGENLYQKHERRKDEAEMELGLDIDISFIGLQGDYFSP